MGISGSLDLKICSVFGGGGVVGDDFREESRGLD